MTSELARKAVGALMWRTLAMGAEKVVFLVRLIILARLLTPEDFGLVAIGLIVLGIALKLTDFGVVHALIQRPATDRRQLDTAWTINLFRGIGLTVVLFIAAPWIAEGFAEPRATEIIRALAFTALCQSAASIGIARLNRELRFGGLAAIRLSAALVNTIVAILLAQSHGVWALVWGALAGAATQMALSYVVAPYRPRLRLSDEATVSLVRFGRWIFVIGVLGVVGDAALRWMIATRLGIVELGLFFMAARLAFLPGQLTTELVSEVAFPVYSHLQTDRRKAAAAFRGLLVSVAALLVPACFVFAWLVPALVEHLLGERWQDTVVVMQLLILGSVTGLLGESLVPVLKGTGNPAGVAVMESLQLVLFVGLGWPLIGNYGLAGAGVAWLSAIAASQVLAARYARRLFEAPFAGVGAPMLVIGTAAALATIVAALVSAAVPTAIGVACALLASAGTAALVTIVLDRRWELGILRTISEPFPWLRQFAGSAPR
jgi:O-antigen/teichoic acid export membrane protein